LLSYTVSAFKGGTLENIATAIRSGNSKALAAFFSSTIEVALPARDGTYSKVQAEMMIREFFVKYPPTSFVVDQKGSSTGGAQFIIGTYKCNEKVFKTYILLKTVEGQLLIQQIQFEVD